MHAGIKLGRRKPSPAHKARALPIERYITRPLPPPPPSWSGSQGAAIAMLGNNRVSNCTFAALGNARAIAAAREGKPPPPTTEDAVVKAYFDFTGGRDDGAFEVDVLDAAKRGVNLGGPTPWIVAAWVSVSIANWQLCKSLLPFFWYLYLGVDLPLSAQYQSVWTTGPDLTGDNAPASWGPHALLLGDYKEDDTTGLVTWGMVQPATREWVQAYTEEAHLLLDAERAEQIGVDWDQLVADMRSAALP